MVSVEVTNNLIVGSIVFDLVLFGIGVLIGIIVSFHKFSQWKKEGRITENKR